MSADDCRYPNCRCGLWCDRAQKWRPDLRCDVTCIAANVDGIICADDVCDIEAGIRRAESAEAKR